MNALLAKDIVLFVDALAKIGVILYALRCFYISLSIIFSENMKD